MIGMYAIEEHERVLATYSARGGVALFGINATRFSRDDYLSSSITPTRDSEVFSWVPFARVAKALKLQLQRQNDHVAGFQWEGGHAQRLEAGFSQQEVRWHSGQVDLVGTV